MTRPRRTPYTAIGIRRLPCFRCGSPATCQWQVCADGRIFRPLCTACDVALNATVLRFMRDPEAAEKLAKYRARLAAAAVPPARVGARRRGQRLAPARTRT